jgi:uncharacterized protein YjlB
MTQPAEPGPEAFRFEDDGRIPNSPLPALVYRGVLDAGEPDPAAAFERLFARHDWRGSWRNGIYGFHHFHSDAHEVLGIARGRVTVRMGGPNGESLALAAGDVIVIPAGVGHKNEGASPDLLVIGAYPAGRGPDLRRGDPSEHEEVKRNVATVPLPATDPTAGPGGPLLDRWRG